MSEKEQNESLFEVDGHQVLDFQVSDSGNVVSFTFNIHIDEIPTSDKISYVELMNKSGAEEILIEKEWIDRNCVALVPFREDIRCDIVGVKKFKLSFTYTLKDTYIN